MKKLLIIFAFTLAGMTISGCESESKNTTTTKPVVNDASVTTGATTDVTNGTVPTSQMAIVQTKNGGADALSFQEIPVLEPGPNEVLIRVVAATINPIDRRSREGGGRPGGGGGGMGAPGGMAPGGGGMAAPGGGMGGGMGAPGAALPSVPGSDVAGVVVKVGNAVKNISVSDAVFAKLALNQSGLNGAYAQYAIAPANQTQLKPTDHTFAEAAGIATVGMTAMRTLDHANVTEGQRVFINGIAGGIGSSAAQFALGRGAYVLGTASGGHHEYLASIGVHEAINYREVQFDEVIKEPVDVVIETVGTATATQAVNILKPGGHLVSIAGPADASACEAKGVTCDRIGGEVGRSNEVLLAEIRGLAEAGSYRLNVDTVFPLEEAGAAQDLNFNVGTRGKIVLAVDPEMINQK